MTGPKSPYHIFFLEMKTLCSAYLIYDPTRKKVTKLRSVISNPIIISFLNIFASLELFSFNEGIIWGYATSVWIDYNFVDALHVVFGKDIFVLLAKLTAFAVGNLIFKLRDINCQPFFSQLQHPLMMIMPDPLCHLFEWENNLLLLQWFRAKLFSLIFTLKIYCLVSSSFKQYLFLKTTLNCCLISWLKHNKFLVNFMKKRK